MRFERLLALAVVAPLALSAIACAPAETAAAPTTPATKTEKKAEPVTTTAATLPLFEETKHKTPPAPPLAAVVKEASASDTPILLYFSTVWCAPCAVLQKEVFPQAATINAIAQWRFQKYDAEFGEGAAVAKQLSVNSYPTLVLMSPKGEEVDRMVAPQTTEGFVKYLTSKLEVAKVGPIKDSELASITDAARLLSAARFEASKPEGSPDRARRLFAAALAVAKKQKSKGLVAEAEFALLQIDAQTKDRKAHVGALLAFAQKHPDTTRAVEALEGLGFLAAETQPRIAEARKVGARVRDAHVAAKSEGSLKRIAGALRKLGDEDGAKKADAALAASGLTPQQAAAGAPPMTMEQILGYGRDPLGPKPALPGMGGPKLPPEMTAKQELMTQSGRLVAEDCKDLPHEDAYVQVRVYVAGGAVTKAVVLDPEVSSDLRTCLEKGALSLKELPKLFGDRVELRVPLQADTKKIDEAKKAAKEAAEAVSKKAKAAPDGK